MAKKSYIAKAAGVTGLAVLFGVVSSGVYTSMNAAQGANTVVQANVREAAANAVASETEAAADRAIAENGNAASDEVKNIYTDKVLDSTTTGQEMSIPDVVENSMPAMVSITNTSVETLQNYFGGFGGYEDFFDIFGDSFGGFGGSSRGGQSGRSGNSGGQEYTSVSAGSGVIIGETDDAILIATNQHVVDNTKELSVAFVNETAAAATVLGEDADHDLAVIAVKKADLSAETLSAIRVIPIGSSDDLRIGETIVCIGNALGYGQSVSSGIVSAKNRVLTDENGSTEGTDEGLIQTDAAINPGNSGGGMFNLKGELVGINSAKDVDTKVEGMCYAIPISDALPILENLKMGDSIEKAIPSVEGNTVRLGISCAEINSEYAEYYGVPQGIYVDEVEAGSAAEKAGLQAGDILTAIDGKDTLTMEALTNALAGYKVGDTVTLTIAREQESSARSLNPSGRDAVKAPATYESMQLTLTFQSNLVQTSANVH